MARSPSRSPAPPPAAPPRPSLRAAQKELTRRRIVGALAELVATEHPLEVSMAAVAERAGVAEPTLYRHFPTKRELFAALASAHYEEVARGLAPESPSALAEDVGAVYARAAAMESTVRWLLAAPDPAGVPRPESARRLAVLRRALREELAAVPARQRAHLLRAALLLTSPIAYLYWKDYLGLDAASAADSAGWILRALARAGPE